MEYQAWTWRGQKDTITAWPALPLQMTLYFSFLAWFNTTSLFCSVYLPRSVFSHIPASRKLMTASGCGGVWREEHRSGHKCFLLFNWNKPSSSIIFFLGQLHFAHKSVPWARFQCKSCKHEGVHSFLIKKKKKKQKKTGSSFFLYTFKSRITGTLRQKWRTVCSSEVRNLLWLTTKHNENKKVKSNKALHSVPKVGGLCVFSILNFNQ